LHVGAYKAGLEFVKARLDVYKKNETIFEEDIKILKLDIMLSDNALKELRKKFEKAEKERDDLRLSLEKFENSSKNLSKLLEIQVSDKFKTGVGFGSQVLDSQVNDKYKTGEGYHAVPAPYTGNFMPTRHDLVLANKDEYVFNESVTSVPDVATSEAKTSKSKPKSVSEPLIEDWISDSEDENETKSKSKQRKPSFAKVEFVKSNEHVKSSRDSVKNIQVSDGLGPQEKLIFLPLCVSNPHQDLKDKGLIDSGCSRHMTGNKSYLKDYEDVYFVKELKFNLFNVSQMCDKKNSILFTDTECVVLSLDFKLTDESHVLLKVPRKDNITEFKNKEMNQFCEMKGIKREFSVARTPQQNRVAERKNRTLIEGVMTMLADSKLPTTFWAEAVNTACYVQNRVLVIKPHNKTTYELLQGRKPALSFMRPFGCPVTILNALDHLGKFDGKADEGFFIGYSMNCKAFRLFDIDTLTKSMNYKPVITGNQSNGSAGTKACDNTGKATVETLPAKDYILLPLWTQDPPFSSSLKDSPDAGFKPSWEEEKKDVKHPENKDSEVLNTEEPRVYQEEDENINNTNNISTVSSTVNTASIKDNAVDENIVYGCANDPNMPNLEEIIYLDDDEDVGVEADMTNMDTQILVSHILITIIHKDHLVEQIIRDIHSAPQTRRMTKCVTDHVEPKKVIQALTDPSWIEAMQNELLRNKKDERGIVVRNKARLVVLGYTQEEGIDYDEMDVKSAYLYGKIEEEAYICQPPRFENPEFPDRVYKVEKALYGQHQAPRVWYETLSTYLLDNGFQRGQIDKTLFIERLKGDILLVQVYVDDIIFRSMRELTFFLGLQVTQKDDGIFISQDKYVDEILKKFGFSTMKIASTPMETSKPLMKDENDEDVDVYLYRSMIGSLMYLTSSRPDIMFVVCACARFQVTSKVSHLHAMKRIFRYLKGQPKLVLWYPKDSPFNLEDYSDSDYAGASLDKKSITGCCQFLGSRLISWQCKKQT
ncbi:retrovirus-related pol polyprotein from transposon TNT 1-94, partial [Tanacetum coccineum]